MQTITISGYYGYGNAGDEAVLAGFVQSLRALRPDLELNILVLSGNPPETESMHCVHAADRYRVSHLLRALLRTDLLVSGGGSLLQDVTSGHSIFYYLAVVRIAQILGKKTMFAAQGIGPLIRPRTRKLVASASNRLQALTVRDEASAKLLREIGVKIPSIEVTADPALLLGSEHPESAVSRDEEVAVSLRPWNIHGGRVAEAAAHALYAVLPHAHLTVVPMQPQHDRPMMEHFARIWYQQGGGPANCNSAGHSEFLFVPPAHLVSLLAACNMVVGMRLHALILAAACAIPSVALAYDPKVTAFMAQCGQLDAVYDLETDSPDLRDLVRRVWSERFARADALRDRLPSLRIAASRNAEVAISLLS